MAAENTGSSMVEVVVTDCAPLSVVIDFQSTFAVCRTAHESDTYNKRSDGQKLTEKLLTVSLTNVLITEVVKLNNNSLVKTVV